MAETYESKGRKAPSKVDEYHRVQVQSGAWSPDDRHYGEQQIARLLQAGYVIDEESPLTQASKTGGSAFIELKIPAAIHAARVKERHDKSERAMNAASREKGVEFDEHTAKVVSADDFFGDDDK